jgi:beta-lactamase class A
MNKRSLCIALSIMTAFGLGIIYDKNSISDKSKDYGEVREGPGNFKFINPLLECSIGPDYLSNAHARPSKRLIEKMVEDEISSSNITYASVYYRDLNNGPWVGVNEKEKFFPASLMKVPLMMYYYKSSESDPYLLDNIISTSSINQNLEYGQYFKPEHIIDVTKSHSVSELIESSIRYSDNYATIELAKSLKPGSINKLMDDLHLELPTSGKDYITVKDYGAFFRVLFNSSFLNQENSEKALKLLSETTFNHGITKYLPKDLVVSHKFGEKEPDTDGVGQIHDCGIVYVPIHPYLVCVMTRGKDPNKMANSIGLISKLIYDEVISEI